MIFYESPHRIKKTITLMNEVMGERKVVLARELTKKFEEIIRGTTVTLQDVTDIKGEMVIVLEGKKEENIVSDLPILEELELLISNGLSSKEAIKQVAKSRNLTKNDVYMEYHENKEKE
jgi:16S rRNA (cytidine1402-2'-O)-methyltransferase